MSDILIVRMLGRFSIELHEKSIDDSSNRMKKVWLLLAYLIYARNQRVTQEGLQALLNGNNSSDALDTNGRLKAMLYRARALLNQMDESCGHDLIIRKNGTYAWNTEVPIWLDVDAFELLCKEAAKAEDKEICLQKYLEAIDLYKGDFLAKLSTESWVIPISVYYHEMYLRVVGETLLLLEEAGRWNDGIEICEKALKIEPYSEELYQHLMRCRISAGDRAGAQMAYEEMSEILFSNFGVMPSEESRQLYRTAARETGTTAIPAGMVRDELKEDGAASGALYCEYDFFKMLYQMQARAIMRSGDVIHIALFSIHARRGKELPRRSLDVAMDNLQETLVKSLRQGDVVTRCSVSQLIVMLPQANYENSCMVCDRVIRAFFRKHPHAPVDIHHSVQPLEPKT